MLTAVQVAEKLVATADREVLAGALEALASDDLMKLSSSEIMAKLATLGADIEGMRRVGEALSLATFTIWCPAVNSTPGGVNFTLFG